MTKRIYCDTNVYLDYLLDRSNLLGRSIGDRAFRVFSRALSCEFEIVFSSWNNDELKSAVDWNTVKMLSSFLKRKTVMIEHTKDDIEKARKMSEHYHDALHVILAQKAEASVLVTSNLQHFLQYRHLIEIKLPQNL
ncbi:hypothetical protein D4Q76_02995 [archaeon]|nr:MAG: hypothetical protein D4Q76_02995 [archaeon]